MSVLTKKQQQEKTIADRRFYMNQIHKAYSKFIINSKGFNNLFDTYKLYYTPHEKTASWEFENPDFHKIVIGNVLKSSEAFGRLDTALENYVYHELAHSEFTDRDIDLVLAKLVKNKIDFPFYNLFEDARIEHLWSLKYNYKFNWYFYQKISANRADEIFFKIIQTANTPKYFNTQEMILYKLVLPYYEEAINTHDHDQMIDLILRFQKEFNISKLSDSFANYKKPSSEFALYFENKKNKGEEPAGESLENEERETYEIDISDLQSSLPQEPMSDSFEDLCEKLSGISLNNPNNLPFNENFNFIRKDSYFLNEKDENLINEIVTIMKKIFKDSRYTTPAYKGKRLNIPRVVLESEKSFNKPQLVKNKKRVHLNFIVDMSASMSEIEYETVNVTYALNTLSRLGFFDLNLILSSTLGCQEIKLPCDDEIIDRIAFATMPGEGLERTIRAKEKLLQKSRNTIILTDGHLTDEPIDKEYLQEKNISLLGIYIQHNEDNMNYNASDEYNVDNEYLLQWFNKSIVKSNVIDVIKELVKQGLRL